MNKESILKSVYLWAFIMLTTLIATVIYKNEFATPSEFEIYIKGMLVPILITFISLVAVKKGDRCARKN